jgi:hypothetical protein
VFLLNGHKILWLKYQVFITDSLLHSCSKRVSVLKKKFRNDWELKKAREMIELFRAENKINHLVFMAD